jgi:hypothetical protein
MKKQHLTVAGMCCMMVVLGLFVFSRSAHAYALGSTPTVPPLTTGTMAGYVSQAQQLMGSTAPLPTAPSWFSDALDAVGQWFQTIMSLGAQSTGAPVGLTLPGSLGSITVPVQNIFTQFDAWLYSIIHFHVAFILNFIFGLVIWILGIAQGVVIWLSSIFNSAAGR